jgi:hypothetical protein
MRSYDTIIYFLLNSSCTSDRVRPYSLISFITTALIANSLLSTTESSRARSSVDLGALSHLQMSGLLEINP